MPNTKDKIIELHKTLCASLHCNYDEFQAAMTIDTLITAENLIANGATIPVRCKECKHMNVVGVGYRWCKAWERIQTMGDDGFCCFGERKDNDL